MGLVVECACGSYHSARTLSGIPGAPMQAFQPTVPEGPSRAIVAAHPIVLGQAFAALLDQVQPMPDPETQMAVRHGERQHPAPVLPLATA